MCNSSRTGRHLLLFLALATVSSVASSADETRPPNFLIVFTDDQGYNDLGCQGSPLIRTPRLDRMAAEGMRFTSFYAQPICGPSRAALMTGCYPMRVAQRGNLKHLHPVLHADEITIAEVLRPRGYATAMIGKWDLAGHTNRAFQRDLLPGHQGFDMHFGTPTSNDNWGGTVLLRDGRVIEDPIRQEETTTKRYTDEAIRFMRKNRSQPFFVYLAHSMPHTALHAGDDFRGKSRRGLYGDVIEEIDHNVGRLLDELESLELVEQTYVLFTSDNGPWLIKNRDKAQGSLPEDHGGSAAPLRSGKVSTWEGGVRVPCIAWAPGRVPAGSVCDKLASTLDVLPTLAALAGAEPPSDRVIDGRDIRHLLGGRFQEADPDRVYYYYFLTHLQAVRQGRWKLHLPRPERPPWLGPFAANNHIAPADDVGFERPVLYDLDADIAESTDVAAEHPEVVARLLALAEEARKDIGDHDRVGRNMRFFDPATPRPTKPRTPYAAAKR